MSPRSPAADGGPGVPRVLIIDTDAAPAAYLDDRFGASAFEVEVAADPAVAFEWAQQSHPDLVLMSADLPQALEAVGWFKGDGELGEVPVVLMARAPSGQLVRQWFGTTPADLTVRTPLKGSFLELYVSHALGAGALRGPLDEESADTDEDEGSVVGTWRQRAVAAEEAVDGALSRARKAENELGMMRVEVDTLHKKLVAAEEGVVSDTGTLLDDTGELEVRALNLERRIAEADRKMARREARAEAAEADLHRQLTEVQALRREIRVTETENERLRGKETTLLADLEMMAVAESQLRAKIVEYRDKLGLAGDATGEFSVDLEDVAVNSAEVERAAHERAARAEYTLKLKEAQLVEIQQDIVTVQGDSSRLQGQLETLRKDLDSMYDREQDIAAERAAEQHRFQTTLHELSEEREKLTESGRRIQELQDEIANRDRQLKILGKLKA